jgi:hypothetical protein
MWDIDTYISILHNLFKVLKIKFTKSNMKNRVEILQFFHHVAKKIFEMIKKCITLVDLDYYYCNNDNGMESQEMKFADIG